MGHPNGCGGGTRDNGKADPCGMTTKEATAEAKSKVLETRGQGLSEICGQGAEGD